MLAARNELQNFEDVPRTAEYYPPLERHKYEIIIIITNEKIKVMLSRKRCKGTLQD